MAKAMMIMLVVVLALLHTGAALKCYQGTETSNYVDCSGTCVKTTGTYDGDSASARSCSPLKFNDGCHKASLVVTGEICYCNTDYCNSATPLALPLALTAALVLLTRFL